MLISLVWPKKAPGLWRKLLILLWRGKRSHWAVWVATVFEPHHTLSSEIKHPYGARQVSNFGELASIFYRRSHPVQHRSPKKAAVRQAQHQQSFPLYAEKRRKGKAKCFAFNCSYITSQPTHGHQWRHISHVQCERHKLDDKFVATTQWSEWSNVWNLYILESRIRFSNKL